MENLQYPIGRFDKTINYNFQDRFSAIEVIKAFPAALRTTLQGISVVALETPYRPDGWTARQVVHHLADSHANLYVRLKLALTEDNPTIKGYDEAIWATLSDSTMDIEPSLMIIEGLHARITHLLENMSEQDYQKTYFHAGYQSTYVLANVIHLYKWHCNHHLQHIKICKG